MEPGGSSMDAKDTNTGNLAQSTVTNTTGKSWFPFRRSSSESKKEIQRTVDDPVSSSDETDSQPASEKRKWWSLLRQPSSILSVLSVSSTTHSSSDSSWYSTSSEYGSNADTFVRPKVQRAVGFFRNILQGLRQETFSEESSDDVEGYCENIINEQAETLSRNSSSGYTDSSSSLVHVVKRQFTVPTYTPSTLPTTKHWVERPAQSVDEFYEHIATTNQAIRHDISSKESVSSLNSEKEIKKTVISALWENVHESKVKKLFPLVSDKKLTGSDRFKLAAKKVITRFRDQRVCYRTGIHHCFADIHAASDGNDQQQPWFDRPRLSDVTVDTNVAQWLNTTVFSRGALKDNVSSMDLSDPALVKYVLLLQSVFRSRLVKKHWRKNPQNSLSLVKACLLIQSVFKSRLAKKKYDKFRKVQNDQINIKNPKLRKSCIFVQSVIRMHLKRKASGTFRRSTKSIPFDKTDLNYDLIKACLMIQSQFRSNLAQKMCLSQTSDSQYSIRDASVLIQSAFRSKLAMQQLSSYLDWINRSSSSESNSNNSNSTSHPKLKTRHISWDPLIPKDTGVEKISLTKQYFMKKKLKGNISTFAQDPKLLRACLLIQSMFRCKLVVIGSQFSHQESTFNNQKHYLTDQNVHRAIEIIQYTVRRILNKDAHYTSHANRSHATAFIQSGFKETVHKERIAYLLADPKIEKAAVLVQSAFRSYLVLKTQDPPTPTNKPNKPKQFYTEDKANKKPMSILHVGTNQKKNLDQDEEDDDEDTLSCTSSDSPCAANEIDLEWSNNDISPKFPLHRQNTENGETMLHRSSHLHDLGNMKKQHSVDSYLDFHKRSFYDPLSPKPREFEYFEPRLPRSNITLQKIRQASQSQSFSISEEKFDYFDPKLRRATQLLQNAFRSHSARKRMQEQWFSQRYSIHHKRADESGVNPLVRRAVLYIQAAFRNKLERKLMGIDEKTGDSSVVNIVEYYKKNTAAKVIQSAFMKHLTRRLLNQTIEQRIQAKHTASFKRKLEDIRTPLADKALLRAIIRRHSSTSEQSLSHQDSSTLRAIVTMQAVFRQKLIHREKAALLVQHTFRRNLLMKTISKQMPDKPKRYKEHVLLLQTVFRRRLFLKIVETAKKSHSTSSTPDSVVRYIITLQALCRVYFTRKKQYEHAVCFVQSIIRRKLFFKVVNNLTHRSNTAENVIRNVVHLQALLRTYLERKQRYEKLVILVQAAFRRKLLMKVLDRSTCKSKSSPETIIHSIILLQQFLRTFLERKNTYIRHVKTVQAACRRKLFEKYVLNKLGHHGLRSVVFVQSAFRDRISKRKSSQEDTDEECRIEKIVLIQRAIRQKLDQGYLKKADAIVASVLDLFKSNAQNLTSAISPSPLEGETEKKKIRFDTTEPYYFEHLDTTEQPQPENANIIKLQSIIRVHIMMKKTRRYINAVKLVQNAFRQKLLLKVLEQQKLLNAVLMLQNAFRRHVVLKTIPKNSSPEMYQAAVFLQSLFRSRLACEEQTKMSTAARLIQGEYRKRLLLKTIASKPVLKSNVICLQAAIRSRSAVKEKIEIEQAACTVQNAFRKHKIIKIAKSNADFVKAAKFFQAAFRRKLLLKATRSLRKITKAPSQKGISIHAVLYLQRVFRLKLLQKSLLPKIITEKQKYENSVVLIQTIIRRNLEKKRVKREDSLKNNTSAASFLDSFFQMNMAQLQKSSKKDTSRPLTSSAKSSAAGEMFGFFGSGLRSLIPTPDKPSREFYITLIQAAIRTKLAWKKQKQEKSVILLQTAFRNRLRAKNIILMQSAFRQKLADKDPSVILIHPVIKQSCHNELMENAERLRLILLIQAACRRKLLEKRKMGIIGFFGPEKQDVFEQHVKLIQSCFRKKLKQKEKDFERAVIMIQSGFRRNILPDLSPMEETSRVSEIELERAALMIQSAFRSRLYMSQRGMDEESSTSSANTVEYHGDDQDSQQTDLFLDAFTKHIEAHSHSGKGGDAMEVAILLLQAAFRRHLLKKQQKIRLVQAVIRRKLLMNLVNQHRDKYGPVRTDLLSAHFYKATILLQSAFRNHLRYKQIGTDFLQTAFRSKTDEAVGQKLSDIERASVVLQAAFRRNLEIKQKSALLIQNRFRAQLFEKVISHMQPKSHSMKAADAAGILQSVVLIQRSFRKHRKMKHVLLLQTAFRKRLLLKQVKTLKEKKMNQPVSVKLYPDSLIRSVILLQTAIRHHFKLKEMRIRILQSAFRKRLLQKLVEKAYGVRPADQPIVLTVHMMKGIRLIQTAFTNKLHQRERAVHLLQTAFRRRLLIKVAGRVSTPHEHPEKLLRAIVLLQTAFRREVHRKEQAASLIQTAFRKKILMSIVSEIEMKVNEYPVELSMPVEQKNSTLAVLKATLLLQAVIRRNIHKKEKAVLMVQSAFRGKLLLRLAHQVRSAKELELWIKTITLVQSAFRRHLRRKERHVILLQTAFRKRLFMNVAKAACNRNQNLRVEDLERLIRGIVMVQAAIRYHRKEREQHVRLLQAAFRRKLLQKIANHSLREVHCKQISHQQSSALNRQMVSMQDLKTKEHHILLLQQFFRRRLLYKVAKDVYGSGHPSPAAYQLQGLIRGIVLIQAAWRKNLEHKQRAVQLLQGAFRRRLLIKVAKTVGRDKSDSSGARLANLLNGIKLVQRVFRHRLRQNEKAALMLQAAFRRRLLIKVSDNLMDKPNHQEAEVLLRRIVMVQTAIRRHSRQKQDACLLLQSAFRKRLLLKLSNNLGKGQLSQIHATNLLRGVLLLQSAFRHNLHKHESSIRLLQSAYRKRQFMKIADAGLIKDKQTSKAELMIRAILLVQSAFRHHIRSQEGAARLVQDAYRRNLLLKVAGKQTKKLKHFSQMVPSSSLQQLHFEKSILVLQAAFRRHLLLKLANDLKERNKRPVQPENLIRGILMVQAVVRRHIIRKEKNVCLIQAAFRRRLLLKVVDRLPQPSRPENLIRGIILVQSSIRNHFRKKEKGVRLLQAAFRKRLLLSVACQVSRVDPPKQQPANLIRGVVLFQSAIRYQLKKKEKAVVMVQTAFRLKLLQKVTMLTKDNKFRDCLRIKRLIGGIILFQTAIRNHRRRKLDASLMIQAAFRRKLMLKVVERANIDWETRAIALKYRTPSITKHTPPDLKITQTIKAVILVQSIIRRHLEIKEQRIIMIQTAFRRKLLLNVAHKALKAKQAPNPISVVHLAKAIVRIQTAFRRRLQKREKSILLVQAAFRKHLLMKVSMLTKGKQEIPPTHLMHSIIMVQNQIRKKLNQKEKSIRMIQALVRRALMIKIARGLQKTPLSISSTEDSLKVVKIVKATILLQAAFRRNLEQRERGARLMQDAYRTRLLLKTVQFESLR
ncbi:hypothetical protein SNE40_017337 [Patella caerulea]|uniref:Uncharacterized protein n=1 Tax=Patella caerulea TaxID=87958 RepID=A0AAN8JGW5_PATCE